MMRFLPRYSLLTLLLITALIAGGVKLWHGPQHVVEMQSQWLQTEYTYTRDWHGNRIAQGPVIVRQLLDGEIAVVAVYYYQQGCYCDWFFECTVNQEDLQIPLGDPPWEECPLSKQELSEFHQVRDAELQRLLAEGKSLQNKFESRRYYLGSLFDPNRE